MVTSHASGLHVPEFLDVNGSIFVILNQLYLCDCYSGYNAIS